MASNISGLEINESFFSQMRLNELLFGNQNSVKSGKREKIKILDIRNQKDVSKVQENQKLPEKRIKKVQFQQKGNKTSLQTDLETGNKQKMQSQYQKRQVNQREPHTFVWFEKKPISKLVTTYQHKLVKVPVQTVVAQQCQIEHRVSYIKKEITQIKPELQKREYVDYRLNYVPVQKLIVHIPQKCVRNDQQLHVMGQSHPMGQPSVIVGQRSDASRMNHHMQKASQIKKQKDSHVRHFVSSQNYDFDQRTKKWDSVMYQIEQLKYKERTAITPRQLRGWN